MSDLFGNMIREKISKEYVIQYIQANDELLSFIVDVRSDDVAVFLSLRQSPIPDLKAPFYKLLYND